METGSGIIIGALIIAAGFAVSGVSGCQKRVAESTVITEDFDARQHRALLKANPGCLEIDKSSRDGQVYLACGATIKLVAQ